MGMKKTAPEKSHREVSSKGGKTTLKKHGREHFSKAGKASAKVRKAKK